MSRLLQKASFTSRHTSLPHKSLHTCTESTRHTPQVVGERIHLVKQQEQGINVKPRERVTGNRTSVSSNHCNSQVSGVWNRGHDPFGAEVWNLNLCFITSQLLSSWGSGSNPINVTIGSGVFTSALEKWKSQNPGLHVSSNLWDFFCMCVVT